MQVDFWEIFWSCMGVIGGALLSRVVVEVGNWLRGKIKDQSLLRHSFALLDIVQTAIRSTNQTFVDNLKKANQFDDQKKQEAFNISFTAIMNQLTPKMKDYIVENFGDIKEHITLLIESELNKLKNNK